jgi:hypothetical protein
MQTSQPGRSLRRDLQHAPGFSAWALLIAVLGSVVGTVFTSMFGTGHWGTLAGAAVGPVISTTFSTKRTGDRGGVRKAIIIILSTGALLITVTGFTFADRVAGKSILPGPDPRAGTFFSPASQPTTSFSPVSQPSTPSATPSGGSKSKGPAIQIQPSGALDCGTAAVGAAAACPLQVTITSAGTDVLRITSVVMTGSDTQDFIPSQDCVGASLGPSQTCGLQVRFQPAAAGPRQATLVIHQNVPWPDQGTTITLTGTGTGTGTGGTSTDPDTCIQGYVWREAVSGDHVCVTPETRTQAAEDNNLAASRRSPTGGAYGPDTCLQGYVWREAVSGDHVCVTPETRTQAAEDNNLAASRRVG